LSRDELSEKLAALYKTEKKRVVVFGLKTKFGGASSQGFGLIYDDEDSQMKFEPKYRLVRVCPRSLYFGFKLTVVARNGREDRQGFQEAQEGEEEPIQEGTPALFHIQCYTNAQVRGTAKSKAAEPSKKK
jgi:small subunit ribosomal protein S24e